MHRRLASRDAHGLSSGGKGLTATTHNSQDWVARLRRDLDLDRGSRRLSPAIDADRTVNLQQAGDAGIKAAAFGPSDPRLSNLTRSYD
jgi:hypothetical protein